MMGLSVVMADSEALGFISFSPTYGAEWGRMRGGAEQFKLLDEILRQNFGPGRHVP